MAGDGLAAHRPFLLFWCSRLLSIAGYQMAAVAIGWQIYELTGSAFDLGLVGLIQFVPVVVLTLLIGHMADRYDRRQILRAAQAVAALTAGLLAVASWHGWLSREFLFVAVFVAGVARAFEIPTWHALLPALVPQALVPRAIAGAATANQAAIICSPAIGGLIYAISPTLVFALCAGSAFLALAMMGMIRIAARTAERRPFSFKSLFGGLQFIGSHPLLLGVITLDLFAVLLGGAVALMPVYAKDILLTGPWGLGLLRSAPAVGALLASTLLTRYPIERSLGRIMFASVAVFGLATTAFGLSTSLPLSLVALAVLGAADAVSVVIRFALVQAETPDDMLGRVSAVNSMFTGTSNTLGEFRAGVMAGWFGAVPAVLVGGIGTVIVAVAWMAMFPALRKVERYTTR